MCGRELVAGVGGESVGRGSPVEQLGGEVSLGVVRGGCVGDFSCDCGGVADERAPGRHGFRRGSAEVARRRAGHRAAVPGKHSLCCVYHQSRCPVCTPLPNR